MSQQKVDYHKEQKRNRKQIMKKEKAMRRLEITILIVILAALVIWFSYLVYRNTQAKYAASHVETTEMDLAGWEKYTENLPALMSGEMTAADVQAEETEEAAEAEDETADDAAAESEETADGAEADEAAGEETEGEAAEETEGTSAEDAE